MSYYTSQVNTKLIDPNVYVANLRAEFQLPKGNYGNRMRLLNVGLTAANTPTYNSSLGALSSIKSIRLLNGRDEIDALRECNRYMAFNKFIKPNQKSLGHTQQETKNNYALVYSGDGTGADAANAIQMITKSMDLGGAQKRQLTTDSSTTPKAYLDLSEVFPFLNSVEVLPADLFSQLRVVIEYETDVRNMISVDNETVTTTRPLLACDVIEDEGLVKEMMGDLNGAVWNAVEHDLTRIAASNADATQVTSNRLNGFNNKRMMRFCVHKVPQDKRENSLANNNVRDGGDLISSAFLNEKFNVKINGRPKISRNGAEYPNQRLGYLVDAYGESTVYYASNRIGADSSSSVTGNELDSGTKDYYGLYVNDIIKDFELEITRDTKSNDVGFNFRRPQSSAYDVHVFADIRKQLVLNGMNYQIIYA